MLSAPDNELVTRIGPGTPGGEMMRRYWQPVALAEELPIGSAPLPIRLLGEDLVLFRSPISSPPGGRGEGEGANIGFIGLIGLHCSHRGADLSYGRLEDGGLRCIYHGWLYDVHGHCLEQPGEPAGSTFHEKVQHRAYPCREFGGFILAYMGPGEPPLLPAYEFLTVPDDHRFVTKFHQDCNYLQGNEGNIDPTHNSYLHARLDKGMLDTTDGCPTLDAEETEFGVRVFALRKMSEDQIYLKITSFVMPSFTTISGAAEGYGVNWHVPIDDTHHWKYHVTFRRSPLDHEARARARSPMTPDYHLVRTASNRFMQDRESMSVSSYSGIGFDFQAQDKCVTEGPGPIQDRTAEHLGYTDRGIMAGRKVLLKAVRDVQEGRDPINVIRDPALNHFATIDSIHTTLPASFDWRHYWDHPIAKPAAVLVGARS